MDLKMKYPAASSGVSTLKPKFLSWQATGNRTQRDSNHRFRARHDHRQMQRHRPLQGPDSTGLVARAPYFHNDFAADLNAVVEFYDTRFGIGFSAAEKADLIAFLKAL